MGDGAFDGLRREQMPEHDRVGWLSPLPGEPGGDVVDCGTGMTSQPGELCPFPAETKSLSSMAANRNPGCTNKQARQPRLLPPQ